MVCTYYPCIIHNCDITCTFFIKKAPYIYNTKFYDFAVKMFLKTNKFPCIRSYATILKILYAKHGKTLKTFIKRYPGLFYSIAADVYNNILPYPCCKCYYGKSNPTRGRVGSPRFHYLEPVSEAPTTTFVKLLDPKYYMSLLPKPYS